MHRDRRRRALRSPPRQHCPRAGVCRSHDVGGGYIIREGLEAREAFVHPHWRCTTAPSVAHTKLDQHEKRRRSTFACNADEAVSRSMSRKCQHQDTADALTCQPCISIGSRHLNVMYPSKAARARRLGLIGAAPAEPPRQCFARPAQTAVLCRLRSYTRGTENCRFQSTQGNRSATSAGSHSASSTCALSSLCSEPQAQHKRRARPRTRLAAQ